MRLLSNWNNLVALRHSYSFYFDSQNADRNGTSVKEFRFVLICKQTGRDGLQRNHYIVRMGRAKRVISYLVINRVRNYDNELTIPYT